MKIMIVNIRYAHHVYGDGAIDKSTLVDHHGKRGEASGVVIATHVVEREHVVVPPEDPKLRERFRVARHFEEALIAFRDLTDVILRAA